MGTVTARIDGQAFQSSALAQAWLGDREPVPILQVIGMDPTTQIHLAVPPRVGTFNLTVTDPTLFFYSASLNIGNADGTVWSANPSPLAAGSSGFITVTTLRPRVVGTFEFTGVNPRGSPSVRRVTEGRFDIAPCDQRCR